MNEPEKVQVDINAIIEAYEMFLAEGKTREEARLLVLGAFARPK